MSQPPRYRIHSPFGAHYATKRYRYKARRLKFKLIPVFIFLQVCIALFGIMGGPG